MVASRGMAPRPSGGEEGDLWLEEAEPGRGRPGRLRRTGVAAAAVACAALVGVPTGLLLSSGGANVALAPRVSHHAKTPSHLGTGPAEQRVVSALSATTDAGSFDFAYDLSRTEPTAQPSVYGASCRVTRCPTSTTETGYRTVVSGHGTLDTDPLAMVATTSIGPTVRVDGTDYWEGGTGTGLVPSTAADHGGTATAGSPLDSFSGLVESTLGARAGAVAMLAMASPTGFLDLAQSEVTGAGQVGTATLDGAAVTEYDVSLDPTQLASTPGSTPEETTTIRAALAVLQQQGLSGMTAELSVDASGYIRQATAVTTFSDGDTVTLKTTLSTFGCAGTVLMPGQSGSATPPAGCTSPDTGVAPSTTTTTATTTTTSPPSSSPTAGKTMTTNAATGTSGGGTFEAKETTTTSVVPSGGGG